MIGKSYDGTYANGTAATGVEGLTTIVPISAISAWYNYSRTARRPPQHQLPERALELDRRRPERRRRAAAAPDQLGRPGRSPAQALCAPDADAAGPAGRRRARRHQRVLARPRPQQGRQQGQGVGVHRPRLPGRQRPHGPRRPVVGRAEGQQRQDASCGCCARVTPIRSSSAAPSGSTRCTAGSTTSCRASTTASTPSPRSRSRTPPTSGSELRRAGRSRARRTPTSSCAAPPRRRAGTIGGVSGGSADSLTFTNTRAAFPSESDVINTPEGSQANRRVFLSPPLTKPCACPARRGSTCARRSAPTQSNLSAVIVDYGTGTQISRTGDGIQNTDDPRTCWGATSTDNDACPHARRRRAPSRGTGVDNACYSEVSKRVGDGRRSGASPAARWTRPTATRCGTRDATPVVPGAMDDYTVPLQPTEHIFKAGHRIGDRRRRQPVRRHRLESGVADLGQPDAADHARHAARARCRCRSSAAPRR